MNASSAPYQTRAVDELAAAGQQLEGVAAAHDRAFFAELDAYVQRELKRLRVPGAALAVIEGDQVTYRRGFGRAHPGGEPPTSQTPFYIGSVTKSFTALAVMQLVDAGRIALDAPVQRYLRWFRVADPGDSAAITVRHLMNQTSGLPGWAGEVSMGDPDDSPEAAARQVRELATLRLTRPVGSKCEYSNTNYQILGLLIEAISGQAYGDYIRGNILAPLGMNRTYTSRAEGTANGLATGHRYWFTVPVAEPNVALADSSLAAGGLISTAEDLARYLIAQLNGGRYDGTRVLSAEGIAEMQRGAVDFVAYGQTMGRYGMGWFVDQIDGEKLLWHGGIMPNFAACVTLLPEQRKGLVLLCNAEHHWMSPLLSEIALGATTLLAGRPVGPSPVRFARYLPGALRAQALLPVLQAAGAAVTLRSLRRWAEQPEQRPSGRARVLHVLLPLLANLLVAFSLKPLLGKRRRYMRLFTPDTALIAAVSGSFALLWGLVRTILVCRRLRPGLSPSGQIPAEEPRP